MEEVLNVVWRSIRQKSEIAVSVGSGILTVSLNYV